MTEHAKLWLYLLAVNRREGGRFESNIPCAFERSHGFLSPIIVVKDHISYAEGPIRYWERVGCRIYLLFVNPVAPGVNVETVLPPHRSQRFAWDM